MFGFLARLLHQCKVGSEVCDVQCRQAVLSTAKEIARAALREVGARDLKAVIGFAQDFQAFARCLSLIRAEKDAIGLPLAASDAPAQLVQLGQAEAVGVLDDHQVGVRHVHADLNDGRCNQNVILLCGERLHHALLVRVFHAAVQYGDATVRQRVLQVDRVLLGAFQLQFALLDQRADDVHLPAVRDLFVDKRSDALPHILPDCVGCHRLAAGRQFVEHGHVEVTIQDERKRARDGCCRHDEHMRRFALGRQRGALRHAKAVLLIRHDRTQPSEGHALLDECVRADHDLRCPAFDCGERCALLRGAHRAGQQRASDAQLFEQRCKRFGMLRRENLGRRHKRGLIAVLRGQRAQRGGNHRFARTDIALHQPVHRAAGSAVGCNLVDRAALRTRRCKGQHGQIIQQPSERKDKAAVRAAALLELLQAAAQQKQLLEHHTAACLPHVVGGLRPVDGGECV